MEYSTYNDSLYGISRLHGIFHLKKFHVWNIMELSGIKEWNYMEIFHSIPGGRGRNLVEFPFHSVQANGMERTSSQYHTVGMKLIAHFAVGILLLHHYDSNLAHLSDAESLVIGLSKSEI